MSIYDQILEEEKRLLEKERPQAEPDPYQAILDEEAKSIAKAKPYQPITGTTKVQEQPSNTNQDPYETILAEESKQGLQPMSEYQRPEQPSQSEDPSFLGALGRGAARSAIPTAAGIAGGAATGAGAGALIGTFAGPAAPIAVPAGALIGGLIGGIGAAYGAERLQDFALDKFLAPETKKAIDEQFSKDAEKQPVASFVGQVAPSFALFRPSPSNLAKAGSFAKQVLAGDVTKEALESPAVMEQVSNLVNVGFGAGTQAGLEAFGQIQNGNFDPLRLGASVVLGALQTEPTALGRKVITDPMQRLDETIRNRGQAKNVATTEPQAESVQPEVQAQQEGLQPFTEFQRPDEKTIQAEQEQPTTDQEMQDQPQEDRYDRDARLFKNWENAINEDGLKYLKGSDSSNNKNWEKEGGIKIDNGFYNTIVSGDTSIATSDSDIYLYKGKVSKSSDIARDKNNDPIVTIEQIVTKGDKRGSGSASKALSKITSIADRTGTTIQLEPTVIDPLAKKGKKALTKQQLVDWYKRNGFIQKYEGSDQILVREPKKPTPKSPAAQERVTSQETDPFTGFGLNEITVGKPRTRRTKRANGIDGETKISISAPTSVTKPENWARIPNPDRLDVTVEARLDFNTGRQAGSNDPVWLVRAKNGDVIEGGRTKEEAIRIAKRYVASSQLETITPSEDTLIGTNDSGEKIYERRKDVARYRMRMDRKDRPEGYPDFGGILATQEEMAADRAGRESNLTPPPSEPPPPTAKPPASPEPQPNPMPKIPVLAKLKPYLDNFRRTFQDKFVDVESLQKRITVGKTQLPDVVNIKQAEELYHGRVGERLTEFDEGQVRPLVEELGKTGVPMDVFERYATAKHAKERNAVIAERDPSKPDGGSGMSNAEADRILDGGIPKDVQAKIEPVRQKLLELNRGTLNNLLEGGLINRDTYDLLTKRYKDYVPLRGSGKEGVEGGTEYEGARITGTGSGLDVRGRDIMTAGGRKSQATDLIAYAVSQHMDSIVRSEKNMVLQTASRLALAYPDNGVIENLRPSEVMKTITYAEDGQTKYARVVDPRLTDAPDIVAYKEDGVAKYLRINDPKLADVMKNRASPVLGSFVEKLGSLNRYFAFINTQASPEFVISNFARDLQTALVNINQNDAKGLATDLVKNVPSSLKATFRAELGTPEANNRMDLFYNEFKREGGRMTFFGLRDFATLQKQIQAEVARGGSNSATKVFGKALDFVGKANSAVENATRLATYATLRERGYTPKQSAYAARNITVNFTRKGTAGPLLNSFYLFFNANIQGSARIIQALATSKKAQRIMLGVMAFGFFRDILNRILGGEDETGVPFYDKIPEYTRRQNFVLMNPLRQGTGEYIKFPMPYGYSVFDYAGQLMGSVMPRETFGGGMSPMKASYRLGMAALDNFNPIGGSYSILQAISPTITTPLVDLALNMDFSGRPIMPTPNPFDPTPPPDSQRYWNNVSPVSKWVAEKINEVTGGSKARAGAVDISPETLDYAVEFLSGAVGKFGERLVTLPFRGMAAAQGDLPLEDLVGEIPMYRKLGGRVPSYVDISRYQEMRSEVLTIAEDLKIAQKEGERAKAIEIMRDAKPELRMVPLIKSTEQRLKELRSERRKLQENYKRTENEAILNRIRANKERQKELMIRALDRYNSSVDDKI